MGYFNRKQSVYILAIILAVIQILFGKDIPLPILNSNVQTPNLGVSTITDPTTAKVIRVIDGDTIEIEGKIKVRYIGVNSPESEQCFANESYLENKKLVEGKTITLIKDVSDKDKYGRLLRYVYIDPSTSSGQVIFVNDYLIKNGFAKIMMIKPDIKYSQQFKDGQGEAKINNIGIWGKCN